MCTSHRVCAASVPAKSNQLLRLELPATDEVSEARIASCKKEDIKDAVQGCLRVIKVRACRAAAHGQCAGTWRSAHTHTRTCLQAICPKVTTADFGAIETRMLAVVGKAREGKSTLLNQMIEQLNDSPSVTASGEHLEVVAGKVYAVL